MFTPELRKFINTALDNRRITAEDVRHLKSSILQDGIGSRLEADALLALDRTLDTDPSWAEFLTAMMVDYVVWGSGPPAGCRPRRPPGSSRPSPAGSRPATACGLPAPSWRKPRRSTPNCCCSRAGARPLM